MVEASCALANTAKQSSGRTMLDSSAHEVQSLISLSLIAKTKLRISMMNSNWRREADSCTQKFGSCQRRSFAFGFALHLVRLALVHVSAALLTSS